MSGHDETEAASGVHLRRFATGARVELVEPRRGLAFLRGEIGSVEEYLTPAFETLGPLVRVRFDRKMPHQVLTVREHEIALAPLGTAERLAALEATVERLEAQVRELQAALTRRAA